MFWILGSNKILACLIVTCKIFSSLAFCFAPTRLIYGAETWREVNLPQQRQDNSGHLQNGPCF